MELIVPFLSLVQTFPFLKSMRDCPLLVLKGINHYWTHDVVLARGRKRKGVSS